MDTFCQSTSRPTFKHTNIKRCLEGGGGRENETSGEEDTGKELVGEMIGMPAGKTRLGKGVERKLVGQGAGGRRGVGTNGTGRGAT